MVEIIVLSWLLIGSISNNIVAAVEDHKDYIRHVYYRHTPSLYTSYDRRKTKKLTYAMNILVSMLLGPLAYPTYLLVCYIENEVEDKWSIE